MAMEPLEDDVGGAPGGPPEQAGLKND